MAGAMPPGLLLLYAMKDIYLYLGLVLTNEAVTIH